MMKVKVVYGSDIRRWRYPSTNKYRSIQSFIQETFGFTNPSDFYLQFQDDEGDHLTLSSESDFEDAFSCAEHESRRSLKIFVVKGPIESAHKSASPPLSPLKEAAPISSSIDFDLISNPNAESEAPSVTEEKGEGSETDCRRLLIDFLTDEKIKALLPDLARELMIHLRAETAKERDNSGEDEDSGVEPLKEIEDILREILQNEKYLPIIAHELYHNRIADMLPSICSKMQCYRHVLLTFSEDAVASWIPHAINVLTTAVTNFEKVDFDVEMDPMCHTFFPTWFAFMDQHGGTGPSNGEAIHRSVVCDQCNADPIRGTRYKCCVCPNFDLCGNCESFGKHEATHPMLKFSRPCWPGQHFAGLHEFMHRLMGGPPGPHPHGPPPHNGRWWGPPPGVFGAPPQHPFGGGGGGGGGRFCRRNRGGGGGGGCGRGGGRRHRHEHNHGHNNNPFFSPHHRHFNSNGGRNKQDDNVSVASSSVSAQSSAKANFPKAEFVEDVNIPDRSYYPVDTIMRKSWKMKNNGEIEWGDDVELVFFKGNECLALEKRFSVLNAAPTDEVLVSAMIRTPKKPGRYCAYYRLAKNGDHFGPRVWVDIFAVEEDEVAAKIEEDALRRAVKESKCEAKRVHKKEKLQKKAAKMSAKLANVEQKLAELRQTPPPPKELEDEPIVPVDMAIPAVEVIEVVRSNAVDAAPAEVDAQLARLVEAAKVIVDEPQQPPPPVIIAEEAPAVVVAAVAPVEVEKKEDIPPPSAVDISAPAAASDDKNDVMAQVLQASKQKREEEQGDSAVHMAQSRTSHSLHISCMCGAPLIETTPVEAYYSGATVNCDICGKYCPSSAPIYHCPAEKTKDHPSGYDLCHQCVQFQMKSFVKRQLEKVQAQPGPVVHPSAPQVEPPQPSQPVIAAVPEEVEVPPQPADDVPPVVEEEVEVAPAVDPFANFPFAAQAKNIMDMGFNEIEKIKFLLMKHKGNVERALQQILE